MDFEVSQDNDIEFEFTNINIRNDDIDYNSSCSFDSETSDLL